MTLSYWWSYVGPNVVTGYDPASRVTSIVTNAGETTVAYGYDNANRQVCEEQTLAGYSTRRVNTPRDADGNRTSLEVPGAYWISYSYTQRNQLASIGSFANFTYDASGNMINRQGQWYYPSPARFDYDDLNRVTQVEEEAANGWIFGRSHYQYDKVGREQAVWRDEGNGRGERFEYEVSDQVKKAWYRAQNVWTSTPTNEAKREEFAYTPDKLNRASVTTNGVLANYAIPNGMNQYTSVANQPIGYDDHFNVSSYNGASFTYDAENHLVGGRMQATYDGLGRCVRRVTSAGTRLYTYDGWKPILEWNGNGSWQAWNIYGAGPDEILARNDATYGATMYKLDKQGSVVALLNGSGNVLERYFYDAFGYPTVTDYGGNGTGHASAWGNRFLYTGREWIAELVIYDYRHRMYHPGLGRFLQTDPMGLQTEGEKLSAGQKTLFSPGGSAPEAFSSSEMNLFRYCGDDPVDNDDPTGLDFSPYTGAPIPKDTIKDGDGMGESVPEVKVSVSGDKVFTLRLDVAITKIYVAQRVHFHSKTKLTVRTQAEKDATFNLHEKQEHGKDWFGFHEKHKGEIPTTRFTDRNAAEEAAAALTKKYQSEKFQANREFNQHQPESRWKPITDQEKPH